MTTEGILAIGFAVMGLSCFLLAVATQWQDKKLVLKSSRVVQTVNSTAENSAD